MPENLVPLISLNDHPIRDAAVWPVISSGYSASSAYAVNAHTVHDNKLYRCIVAISLPGESWTSAHWAETTIDEELSRGIQQGIDALHVLAREYDPTSAYLVNNYVMKDGTFYRCIMAINAPGETWDSSHWSEVTVASELDSHKNAINSLDNALNSAVDTINDRIDSEVDTLNDKIDDSIEELSDIIADAYVQSNAYPKDSYVIKNGKMYVSLADVPANESWLASNWRECTVGEELTGRFTQENVAPEYDPTQTYGRSVLVMYKGQLYKCTNAISIPEAWNPSHWELTTISNEVAASDIVSVFGFFIDDEGYLCQNIASDGFDPSTVNPNEVLGFYISDDGYISQKVTA